MSKNFEFTGNYKESMEKGNFFLLTDEELVELIEDYKNSRNSSGLLYNCVKLYTEQVCPITMEKKLELSFHVGINDHIIARFIDITKNKKTLL